MAGTFRAGNRGTARYAERSMSDRSYLFCAVSLPVPLDQPFTYSLPETLRHRVRVGSRLVVPFGPRKLTGAILRCHDDQPSLSPHTAGIHPPGMHTVIRDALRLIDSEPVLSADLLALGKWIS